MTSKMYFRNTLDARAAKAVESVIDSCASDGTTPRTERSASSARVWTDERGRDWLIKVSIDVARVRG